MTHEERVHHVEVEVGLGVLAARVGEEDEVRANPSTHELHQHARRVDAAAVAHDERCALRKARREFGAHVGRVRLRGVGGEAALRDLLRRPRGEEVELFGGLAPVDLRRRHVRVV